MVGWSDQPDRRKDGSDEDYLRIRSQAGQVRGLRRGTVLEWVPVQMPSFKHAVRALLTAAVAVAIAGAAAVPVSAATRTPHAAARSTARPIPASGPTGIQIKGGALANASTGRILWSEDLNTERPIGSIVKVMTALIVLRAGHLDQTITVPKSVVAYLKKQDQPSTAGLIPGDKLTARELLEALLLPSGCDAAYTLAEAYGPGLDAFIAKMNAEAKDMGLTSTHFSNFDGLPWPSEYSTWSTPANLITLGRHAMRYGVFRAIVGQASYSLPAGDGHHAYQWQNTNPLIGTYAGAIGIKTGDTKAAGNCLLFEATRGGLTLIGVTLGTPGDDISVTGPVATKVLNWGFKYF
jgi:serine-type D-Ala-D-Ala carboxypeptidase (penicillin-binding protein 5/6)